MIQFSSTAPYHIKLYEIASHYITPNLLVLCCFTSHSICVRIRITSHHTHITSHCTSERWELSCPLNFIGCLPESLIQGFFVGKLLVGGLGVLLPRLQELLFFKKYIPFIMNQFPVTNDTVHQPVVNRGFRSSIDLHWISCVRASERDSGQLSPMPWRRRWSSGRTDPSDYKDKLFHTTLEHTHHVTPHHITPHHTYHIIPQQIT